MSLVYSALGVAYTYTNCNHFSRDYSSGLTRHVNLNLIDIVSSIFRSTQSRTELKMMEQSLLIVKFPLNL